MKRECTGCGQEYNGTGIGYELRDDHHKVIEKGRGHESCMEIHISELKSKLNKKKEKKNNGKRKE